MVAIYDPDRLIFGHEVELSCLDPEYYEDWVPFAARAPGAGCAVVVLGNETTGHPPSRRPGTGTQMALRGLRPLSLALGPVPLVIVLGAGATHARVGRVPVDIVVHHADLARLPAVLADLLAVNPRVRLADAVETANVGLPRTVQQAFVTAMRDNVVRSCLGFAELVNRTDGWLRETLRDSPAGRAGRTLIWFVHAALLMRASEKAAAGSDQLRAALELRTIRTHAPTRTPARAGATLEVERPHADRPCSPGDMVEPRRELR
jgi:hypothetical protein